MIHNLTPDLAEACKTLGNLSLDLSLFPDPPEDVLREAVNNQTLSSRGAIIYPDILRPQGRVSYR